MRYSFHAEQWVPCSVEEIFAFFADPANLPALMPRWQQARIEASKLVPPPAHTPAVPNAAKFAGAGSEMTISFRPVPLSPLRITWQAKIVEFEWDHYFCDEQPRGPFHYWRHCHRIAEATRGGISGALVVDELEYELPLGWLGDLAQRIAVGRQVKAIFAYRQKRLLETVGRPVSGRSTAGAS